MSHIRPLLRCGIGIHHSGLLPIIKEVVEILFQEQLIKVCEDGSMMLCPRAWLRGQLPGRAGCWERGCRVMARPHAHARAHTHSLLAS